MDFCDSYGNTDGLSLTAGKRLFLFKADPGLGFVPFSPTFPASEEEERRDGGLRRVSLSFLIFSVELTLLSWSPRSE